MSGYLQGQVWRHHVDRGLRDVLLAMADHAYDDGTHIYPSMAHLAWKLDISKRQVQRVVARLREMGALVVVREATRYDATHYRMDLSVFSRKMPLREGDAWNAGVTDPSSLSVRGDIERTSGVTSSASRGDVQMSPEPSKETSENTSAMGSASARVDLPEGFPDELRPHLRGVYRALRDLAQRQNAKAVKPLSLASVVMARPHKPLVRSAHDYVAWADSKAERRKDVVSGYRNWLDKVDDLAGVEAVDSEGFPLAAPAANGNGNGRPVGILERQVWPDGRSWRELTSREQANARDSMAMGGRPWEPELAPARRVLSGPREVVTADTFALVDEHGRGLADEVRGVA